MASKRHAADSYSKYSLYFNMLELKISKKGIEPEHTYNIDKKGFIIRKIGKQKQRFWQALEDSNREWVTLIACVGASGVALPPGLIMAGDSGNVQDAWVRDIKQLKHRCFVTVTPISNNGWTNNKLGVEWLKHFHAHTKTRCVGARCLLILDGHESHHSLEFQELCKENNICTLCMPPYSSHLLQPLDVGCFLPLKRAYSRKIEALIRHHINHITKLEFLPAFKAAFDRAFTTANICSAFQGAGLVPLHPDVVLSKL
ncbi:DDE-domain-containing protein, partial [Didymella exigua CBS 183.55]